MVSNVEHVHHHQLGVGSLRGTHYSVTCVGVLAFFLSSEPTSSAVPKWFMLLGLDGPRQPQADPGDEVSLDLRGAATGAIAGLVAITPAAGFVPPIAAIPIGIVAAVVGYYFISLRMRRGIDDSLDVWAVHGVCGTWGALATGIFASAAVNAAGADGLILGNALLLAKQVASVAVVWAYAFGVTWVLAKILKATIGLRVKEEEEVVGLDIAQHGERAYGGIAE